jgi:hypothetical protein
MQFPKDYMLAHHISAKHQDFRRCKYCDHPCSDQASLSQHTDSCEKKAVPSKAVGQAARPSQTSDEDSSATFKCRGCAKTWTQRRSLLLHEKACKHLNKREDTSEEHLRQLSGADSVAHKRQHFDPSLGCIICKIQFSSEAEVNEHVDFVHVKKLRPVPQRMLDLPQPTKDTPAQVALKASRESEALRERVVVKNGFICEVCSGYLPQSKHSMLAAEGESQDAEACLYKFRCEDCPRVYKKKLHLVLHQKTHAKQAKSSANECEVCHLSFSTDSRLKSHRIKTHQNIEIVQQCAVCLKVYSVSQKLNTSNKYSLVHYCPYCPKTFSESTTLTLHVHMQHKEAQQIQDQGSSSGGQGCRLHVEAYPRCRACVEVQEARRIIGRLQRPPNADSSLLS